MRCVHFLLFATGTLGAKGLQNIHSTNFNVDVDPDTGALLSIVNPKGQCLDELDKWTG